MRNISNESCRENLNIHFTFGNFFFSSENDAIYEIISKSKVERQTQLTVWRLCVADWIRMAKRAQAHARARSPTPTHGRTHAHACIHPQSRAHAYAHKFVILIAFPRQQLFCKRVSVSCYTHIACLVSSRVLATQRF